MSDFAEWAPREADRGVAPVRLRSPPAGDVEALAHVLAVRGGNWEDHLPRARRIVETMPVAVVAEGEGRLLGWCGAGLATLDASLPPVWMVSGMVVVPEARRCRIGHRLLEEAMTRTSQQGAERIFSIVNARNRASIALHEELGFVEQDRGPTFAGVYFDGGLGVLLRKTL